MHWKVSCDKREAGRQEENEQKERPFVAGQLWSGNDAWKNIVLSLVSTQFVMSLTNSFNRLEKCLTRRKVYVFLRATLPSDKSKQMTQSKHLTTCRIQLKSFWFYLLSFLHKNIPTVFYEPGKCFGVTFVFIFSSIPFRCWKILLINKS